MKDQVRLEREFEKNDGFTGKRITEQTLLD